MSYTPPLGNQLEFSLPVYARRPTGGDISFNMEGYVSAFTGFGGGTIQWSGGASGRHGISGSASVLGLFTGSAVGFAPSTGYGYSGAEIFTGEATGLTKLPLFYGSGIGYVPLVGSAVGYFGDTTPLPIYGLGYNTDFLSGSGTALFIPIGVGSSAMALSGSASGNAGVIAQGIGTAMLLAGLSTAVTGFSGSASGAIRLSGVAKGNIPTIYLPAVTANGSGKIGFVGNGFANIGISSSATSRLTLIGSGSGSFHKAVTCSGAGVIDLLFNGIGSAPDQVQQNMLVLLSQERLVSNIRSRSMYVLH